VEVIGQAEIQGGHDRVHWLETGPSQFVILRDWPLHGNGVYN
jgi:hypothetical protein